MPWHIDTVRSRVGFAVKHMMVATVRGQFRKYSATIHLLPEDFTRSAFEGEIEMASVDTGNADRDDYLRTSEFLDAARHPKIAFASTRIESRGGSRYVACGDLTIRGVTRPVAVDVEYLGTSKNPSGRTIARIRARGAIRRKDFGVSLGAMLEAGGATMGEKVMLEIEIEATHLEDAAPAT